MLPWLSRLSVSVCPGSRLRHRCSSQYLRISPLHWEFHFPLQHSSSVVSQAIPRLSLGLSPMTSEAAYAPFTPSNSEQRLPPPYYRGCWHGVSRGFLQRYRHFLRPSGQEFTFRKTSSSTRRCWVRLSPIAQNSPLLPPVGVWAVSQYSVAVRPLRPATDRCLGRPLPHLLTNPTRAPPETNKSFPCTTESTGSCGISSAFAKLSPTSG